MSTSVLATKLFPPSRRSGLVTGSRPADLLDDALDRGHRLILVSAPAGFGKTTLISDWTSPLADHHGGLGWLSLDGADNDLPRFLAHLPPASPLRRPWRPPVTDRLHLAMCATADGVRSCCRRCEMPLLNELS